MNERLTLQDLIDLLAKKQDITKKDAETFLRELIALISETIEANEPVKIKDFGTFKLVRVNARKSVDVNTGADIEIAAHYKLSFAPDKSLKEAVNKPFAHFESVQLEDGVTFDNIEDEIADLDKDDSVETDQPIVEELPIVHVLQPDEKIVIKDVADEVEEAFDAIIYDDQSDRKSSKRWYVVFALGLFVLIAAFLFIGGYLDKIPQYIEAYTSQPADSIKEEPVLPIDSIGSVDSLALKVDSAAIASDGIKVEPSVTPENIGEETIRSGHTLRNISLQYYGHKSFWVYIYEANRDKIANPNNVPLGTKLVIPSLNNYGIDPKEPKDLEIAKAKERALFKAMD